MNEDQAGYLLKLCRSNALWLVGKGRERTIESVNAEKRKTRIRV